MVLAEDKGTLLQIRGSADGTKAHGAVEAVGNTDQEGPYGVKKPSSLLNIGNECAGFKGILCSIPVTHPYPATPRGTWWGKQGWPGFALYSCATANNPRESPAFLIPQATSPLNNLFYSCVPRKSSGFKKMQ